MSPNSHHPQHFHLPNHHLQQLQLQHQHQQHQQQLQIHQQQQQQQQQQRSAAVNGNAPNATSSPVMNFLPTAATIPTASAPSSSSSTPAASGPEDIERPQKRQRTSASNLSLAPRLPLPRLPPPSANVAPPPVNVPPPAPRSTLQHKQQHRQISHQKATAPPPLKPAPLSTASPLASPAVSSSVPFMRVQEQGSTETFALPLAAVQSWETLATLLRDLFSKPPHSTPKLKTHRGDTIIKPLIKHFLKDNVHLIVTFEDISHPTPSPSHTGSSNASNSPTFGTNNNTPSTQNPPTPYSPPIHHPTSSSTSTASAASSESPLQAIPALSFPPRKVKTPKAKASNLTLANTTPPSNPVPEYKMSRTLSTVAALWKEWKQGLDNSPSVESLESNYGPRWRTSQAERKFYSRRKVIIEEVTKRIAGGADCRRAIEEVESLRASKSLDGLSKMIVERRKLSPSSAKTKVKAGSSGNGGGGGGGGASAQEDEDGADW